MQSHSNFRVTRKSVSFPSNICALAILITVASATAETSKEVIRAVKASTENPYLIGRAEVCAP